MGYVITLAAFWLKMGVLVGAEPVIHSNGSNFLLLIKRRNKAIYHFMNVNFH